MEWTIIQGLVPVRRGRGQPFWWKQVITDISEMKVHEAGELANSGESFRQAVIRVTLFTAPAADDDSSSVSSWEYSKMVAPIER